MYLSKYKYVGTYFMRMCEYVCVRVCESTKDFSGRFNEEEMTTLLEGGCSDEIQWQSFPRDIWL